MQRIGLFLAAFLLALTVPFAAQAHPAPFSYLDLHLEDGRIYGSLTVHVIDLAHEMQSDEPATMLDRRVLSRQYSQIGSILQGRMAIGAGELPPLEWQGIEPVPDDHAVRLTFTIPAAAPAALDVSAHLFPYDPAHQTFVNVYDRGQLAQQWILTDGDSSRTFYAGTVAGAFAVVATFVQSGVHHIIIGPDHILFVIALILLGGTWRRLALIVTSFTIGHSVTLSLAATGLVMIPPQVIEPLIALSIVVVAADNLLRGPEAEKSRDLRAAFAFAFGLIHGFGFAYVLRALGLPDGQLALSLASFNVGVEIGQLAIVLVVAFAMHRLRQASPARARQIATIGSLAVAAAGAYWFFQRVLF